MSRGLCLGANQSMSFERDMNQLLLFTPRCLSLDFIYVSLKSKSHLRFQCKASIAMAAFMFTSQKSQGPNNGYSWSLAHQVQQQIYDNL